MSTSSLQAEKIVYTSLRSTISDLHTIRFTQSHKIIKIEIWILEEEEKSLIYNTSFLGEYECSSLALDRRRKKVDPVDVVFDGAFGGVGDEEVVVGEGVVVISSSLDMLTNSCLGGIMVSLIFLEGLDEKAFVKFIVE
ncbi:hypothetical protein Tco_1108153 [Tanacetum coccineum]